MTREVPASGARSRPRPRVARSRRRCSARRRRGPVAVRATARRARSPRRRRRAEPRPTGPRAVAARSPPPRRRVVVVGAGCATEAARDRTASATVIDADRFAGEAKGVAELVATAPGRRRERLRRPRPASPPSSIRGATADGVLVLLDGIPLNTAFGGGVDLSSHPAPLDRPDRGRPRRRGRALRRGRARRRRERRHAPARARGPGPPSSSAARSGRAPPSLERQRRGPATRRLLVAASVDGERGALRLSLRPAAVARGSALDATTPARTTATCRGGGLVKLVVPLGAVRARRASREVSGGHRELPPSPAYRRDGSRDWQQDARALLALRAVAPVRRRALPPARGALRLDQRRRPASPRSADRRAAQRGGVASAAARRSSRTAAACCGVEAVAESEWLDAAGRGGSHSRPRLVGGRASEELRLADGRIRIARGRALDRVGGFDGVSAKLGASARRRRGRSRSARARAAPSARRASPSCTCSRGSSQPNPDLRSEEGTGATRRSSPTARSAWRASAGTRRSTAISSSTSTASFGG